MLCGSIILYLLLAGPSRRKEMFCSVCNNTNALPEGWFMAFLRRHHNNLWSRKHVKCPHSRNIKRSFYVPSFIISTLTAAHQRSWNCHSHSWILHTCFPSVAPKSERAVPETVHFLCTLPGKWNNPLSSKDPSWLASNSLHSQWCWDLNGQM